MEEQAMIQKMQKNTKQKGEKREKIDKNTAFIEYKETDFVRFMESTILQIRREMTANRDNLKLKTERINLIKSQIDGARNWLEQKSESKR